MAETLATEGGGRILPRQKRPWGIIVACHYLAFLTSYGYLAILLGAVFEGETIVVIAGLAIHEGYLSLPLVFLCAFVGAMLGDAFFFFLGRYGGDRVLHTLPFVHRLLVRPQQFISRTWKI